MRSHRPISERKENKVNFRSYAKCVLGATAWDPLWCYFQPAVAALIHGGEKRRPR